MFKEGSDEKQEFLLYTIRGRRKGIHRGEIVFSVCQIDALIPSPSPEGRRELIPLPLKEEKCERFIDGNHSSQLVF